MTLKAFHNEKGFIAPAAKITHEANKTRNKDLDELLYNKIVSAIINKSLRPGEHINEMQLASANKLSRPRVRKVLERLELEGVIEFKTNRGAFISRPTVKEAYDVFEARLYIETAVFTLACERVTEKDIKLLRDHINLERESFELGTTGFNNIAGNFHVLVAEIVNNKVLLETVKLLIHRVCLIQSLYETEKTVLCLVDEHEELVNYIENKKVNECINKLTLHFENILSSLNLSEQYDKKRNIYQSIT